MRGLSEGLKRPNIDKSRELRKKQTDAEQKLWSILRDRRLSGIKFRRQFSIDSFILDFYAPEHKLAIEADGGQHYENGLGIDSARDEMLANQGIRTLRFSNKDILLNIEGVCEIILRSIEDVKPPHLRPLPLGRGNN